MACIILFVSGTMKNLDLCFSSRQSDTCLHCGTTDTGLLHRVMCLFIPHLSPVVIMLSCRGCLGVSNRAGR